jgi:signal transduction histidine kinase
VTTGHLRFSPDILRRLGEELVPHADVGIVELVRNAYDADAGECLVSLAGTSSAGGTVLVRDDGEGMTALDIQDGWLLLGRSAKVHQPLSPSGRRRVGEKGLGRLSALRLGDVVTLTTRPSVETGPRVEHELRIDWREFDEAVTVEEVALQVMTRATSDPPGTEVLIESLRQRLSSHDVQRLARALVLLTGPFQAENTFRAVLDAPEFTAMERLVSSAYFEEYEYLLTATLNSDGTAAAELRDWRGEVLSKATHAAVVANGRPSAGAGAPLYGAPPARFELWSFNLSKAGFDLRHSNQTVAAVQAWLAAVGGIHLFQRGLRVHPYGDPGHDWLELNLRRARDPQQRPSSNTAVGRVVVDDDEDCLTPKTDRTGFVENEAFLELRRFGVDVLEWAADARLRLHEEQKTQHRQQTRSRMVKATEQVERSVADLPATLRPKLEKALARYQVAVGEQLRTAEDDLQLYRTLSTVGTTTAVFAHETLRPVAIIEQMAASLQERVRSDLPERYDGRYSKPLDLVLRSASSLRTFAELPMRLLQKQKRRPAIVDVNLVVIDLLTLFRPYLDEAAVDIQTQLSDDAAEVTSTVAAIEAILSNLIANAVYFFGQVAPQTTRERRLVIRTTVYRHAVILSVLDSGPGVHGIDVDDVWLPGRTTREGGTGLGLTIVRDITRDLSGKASAVASGELGGAEFHIEMPRPATSSE